MSDPQLSAQDLDYLQWLDQHQGPLSCACQFTSHGPAGCAQPAAVTVEVHLPHVCRQPQLREIGIVNQFGNVSMFVCRACYTEAKLYADAKIAQARALAIQRSATCQRCGAAPLVSGLPGQPKQFLRFCPGCGLQRIQFDPVCGAGVIDARDGLSHGCGAPLKTPADIIRGVKWLDGEVPDGP
jgi:hypothetical protein